MLKLEALMQETSVDIVSESHKSYGFIPHLSDKCSVLVSLCGNQLSQEVLAISLSYSFRLIVENIGQIIVIFLLGGPYLNERHQKHSRREIHARTGVNASQVLHGFSILAFHLLE